LQVNVITSTDGVQLIDPAELRRTLPFLLPDGQVAELRALEATTLADRWPHTATGYFDDREKLVEALSTIRTAKGIYLTINPIDPALLARAANRIRKAGKNDGTSDRDILARRWLPIDCDPVRAAGISSDDAEHAAAIERSRAIWSELHYNRGWPEPIAADSGNGGHLLYRVDLPVDDGGLLQRCLLALAAQFSDDAVKVDAGVFNPARIWKLYGTAACKGDHTESRPHRMSRVAYAPSRLEVVTREQLEELAGDAPTAQREPAVGVHVGNGCFDIDGFLQRAGFELDGPDSYQDGRKWTFRTSPLCEHHGDGPYLIQFASGALAAGCHHDSCSWTWHDLRQKFDPKPAPGFYDRLLKSASATKDEKSVPFGKKPVVYQRITSRELDGGAYDVSFHIENTMAADQPLVIAGQHKSLKTSFIIDAAVSLAAAGFFLGKFRVDRPWRTAVMSGESGLAVLQETATRVCTAAGLQLKELDNLIWSPDLPKFGQPAHVAALDGFLTVDDIEVLFIDPAYLAMPGADAGNLMLQGELLRDMGDLCRSLGVTLVIAHHTKRTTGRAPYEVPELADIAWAGFAEFARQWWLLGRREKYEPGTGGHKLWLSIGGSAGHSGLWAVDVEEGRRTDLVGRRWEVSVKAPHEARDESERGREQQREQQRSEAQQRRLDNDKAAIIRAMTAIAEPETGKAIRTRAGLPGDRFNFAIAAVIEGGFVEPCQVLKSNRKQPYDGFRLKDLDNPL